MLLRALSQPYIVHDLDELEVAQKIQVMGSLQDDK